MKVMKEIIYFPKEEHRNKQKAEVYLTKDLSPVGLGKAYDALGVELQGKIAVKISTGEPGGHNFLSPDLIKGLIKRLNGTIVE